MLGEDLNEVAYQLRRDMEIERANRARVAYGDAMAHSEISPEFAAEQLKLARKGKGGNATPEQVQQNKLEEEYDWRADPRFVGEYNARIANDVKFANFIKGDIRNVSTFEKVWHRISGDDGEAKNLGKAIRNSFARGGQNLMNTLPIFGNVSELEDISKEIEHIEQGRKAIAEGKAAEFFGDEDDPSGLAGSYRFQKNADVRYAELVERRRMLSGAVARHQQIASLYPQTEAMQEFQNTKGFGEAAGWALTHPLEMLANTGPEMAVQMAPMIALGLATSPAGVAGVALGQGLYSYGMDSSASILEYMGDAGIDVTDPKAIESFFSDRSNPTFTKVMTEAYAHATPTALLDMLAVPAALMRMPARITGRAHHIAPSATRAYNALMESPRMSRLTNAVLQTQVQGLLGGAGEALGQIAAKGEITSYADIIAEFVGEHFSAPFEVLNASRAASADLALLKQRNDLMQNHLMEAVDAAQRSTSLPLDPQTHKETLDAAGEQSEENDPVEEALWQRIPFNPEMISDEAKAQLAQESPAFAEALRQAEQTGEEASIAYSDFVTQVARSESATEFVKATHVPMEMSNGEIALVALNQTEEAAQELAEEKRATFRTSLKAVAKEIGALFDSIPEPARGSVQRGGEMGAGEKKAVASLVLSHVAAMAKDLGVTPEEFWKKYGLGGVLSERNGQIPLQPDDEGTITRGAYVPSMRKILLTVNSNKSTFIHETGHWFLDTRVKIALSLKTRTTQGEELTDEQKRFLDITEKTVEWLMPGKPLEEFASMSLEKGRRAADEKFARTYEAYLYEGNAPTGALLSMFRKFSGWLRGVYASIASIPQAAPMTDGVRELFDGLFVASEQAREAILYRGIYKATEKYIHGEDGADAIKKAIADAYADLEESVREAILSAYTRDAERLRNLRKGEVKRLTKAGVEALERIKSEIRKRVTEEPAQKAYKALTEGTAWGKRGKVKLRILANENRTVGGVDLYTTVDSMLAHEDYVDIEGEDLAKRLGFTSEDEMVKALESRRPIEEVVNEEAAERFMAEHGELATPEAIQRTADLAIYGKAMEALLTNELKGLDKAVGNKTYTKALLKPVVDAVLGRVAFKDLKPAKYRADATRAAVKSLSFLTGKKAYTNKKTGETSPAVKHDTIAAAQEKRRQLFHSLKAEQAQKIRDEIAKRVKRLKKVISTGNPKNMPVEYLEMVELLCFRYDLINKLSERERVYKTWEEFAKQQTAKGIAMPRMPELKGSFGEYTVNEINEILSGIESLAGIGKDLETVRKGVEKIAVEQARKEIAQSIIGNAVRRGMKPILRQRGEGQKSKNEMTFRKFFYSHRRIASFLQCMEGTQFGKLWEYVIKPFDAAGNREIAMRAELSAKAAKIFEPLRSLSEHHKPIYRERLGASFTDAEILAMALNLNSEENLQRLLAGSTRYAGRKGKDRWTAEDVISTVSEVLTADQLAAVQEVWDLCGSLWDDVVELEHDMNHRAPKPVKPRETKFMLLDGEVVTLRGGYYPVRYDKNISDVSPGENIDDDHSNALSAITGRPHTPDRSHTLERTNGVPPGRAIELTLTAGFSGLDAIVHDLCWRRELTQMDKLFAPNGEFRTAVKDYWGAEAVEEIKKWIEDIAAGDKGQSESADVIANALRSNVSLAGIGFNLVTAAVQLTGLTQSVVALGPKWAMTGLGEFMKNPRKMLELARSKSQLMADRGRTQFRELGEVHSSIAGTVSKPKGMIMKYAYMPIVLVQTMVDVPTWLGGYHKALADGCSEREAIARADRVLIDSQGSGRLQDLAGVERSGPWKKLFTVFYTFFSATYNLALVKGQTETGVRRALDLLALLAVQPVLEGFLREALKVGGDDDDDDDWPLKYLAIAGQSVASFNMGMLVGVRELSGIIDGFGYRGPTGMRKIEDIYKLATQVKQGELDEGLLRALNSVASDWVGYPAVPINRAISGVNALANDETDNWLAPFLGYSKY